MRQSLAEIATIETIGPFTRLRFRAPDLAPALEPGRALLLRASETYLRRTAWPCAIDGEGFSLLCDVRSPEKFRAGDSVDVLGPIGRGFRVESSSQNLLLAAAGSRAKQPDVGPLLALVDQAVADRRSVTLADCAAQADQTYPIEALPPAVEVIHVRGAGFADTLRDAIVWADQVFACGPDNFVEQLSALIESMRQPAPRGFAQALRLVDLPCGVGACGACRARSRLACLDGPVFDLNARPGLS